MRAAAAHSDLDDGEDLSFGHDLIEADKDRFDFSSRRRSDRNFHLHGFDKGNIVAFADAGPDFNRKRANPPGDLRHDLDLRHHALRVAARSNAHPFEAATPRLPVVAADCLR